MNNLAINTHFVITDHDILLNDESVEYCNGIKIQNREKALYYFDLAKMFFFKEFNLDIIEFHIAQANNLSNVPVLDIKGNFCWERIMDSKGRLSDWVVTDFYTISSSCSANMFLDCANLSRANSAFRFGLAKTFPEDDTIIKIN